MPSTENSLQEPFLSALRDEATPVSVFLVNGIRLTGCIESFDQYVVILKGQTSQMVYKHAISTVVPSDGSGTAPKRPPERRREG